MEALCSSASSTIRIQGQGVGITRSLRVLAIGHDGGRQGAPIDLRDCLSWMLPTSSSGSCRCSRAITAITRSKLSASDEASWIEALGVGFGRGLHGQGSGRSRCTASIRYVSRRVVRWSVVHCSVTHRRPLMPSRRPRSGSERIFARSAASDWGLTSAR